MGVSGSGFSTTPVRKHVQIKDRAKFHKKIPTATISDIIRTEADKDNKSLPKPSATIK